MQSKRLGTLARRHILLPLRAIDFSSAALMSTHRGGQAAHLGTCLTHEYWVMTTPPQEWPTRPRGSGSLWRCWLSTRR